VHREGGGGGKGGEDGGSNDSDGNRMQELVVAVIRHRSPCTPTRGIATHSSPDLNKAAVLGMLSIVHGSILTSYVALRAFFLPI
jgi:hypothetical protein